MIQLDLIPRPLPIGFRYLADFITSEEENFLIEKIKLLSFAPYIYGPYQARREVVSFGTGDEPHTVASSFPDFILPFRKRISEHFNIQEDLLTALLFTRYPALSSIGWHEDAPMYREVYGISLSCNCYMDFRLQQGESFQTTRAHLERRSAYCLTGPARRPWQHRIATVEAERLSITFRTFRNGFR